MKYLLCLLFLTIAAGLSSIHAEEPSAIAERLKFDQNLGQQVTLELPFRDENETQVKLGDYFGARPVILMLGYYRCPMLCTAVADGLTRCLRTLPLEPGRDFELVTVSIDPEETPELALGRKAVYVKGYGRPGAAEHWHCLTGLKEPIETLARQVGFKYFRDASNNQYAHASAVYILSPTGKITRYFFGLDYSAQDLRLALAESTKNKTGGVQEQLLSLCMNYDPATGRYGLSIIKLLRAAGVLTVAALAAFILMNLWREKRRTAIAQKGA